MINKITQSDSLDFLQNFHSKDHPKAKLILTDPPYGMNYKTNIPGDRRWNKKGTTKGLFKPLQNDESTMDLTKVFAACYDALETNGFLFVFCNDKALREWSYQAEKAHFLWKDTLFWNKKCANGGDLRWPFIQIVEMILCFVKGKFQTYPMYNKKRELKKRIVGYFEEKETQDDNFQGVFDAGRVSKKEQCGHPTQKPLYICEQIIKGTTKENDIVLDPYCGSGSTLVAAKRMKRRFAGCDIEKEYVKIAKCRIKLVEEKL